MRRYFPCTTFVFIVFLCGCNNTVGKLEIKGKVVDDSTKVPVRGITIMIQAVEQTNEISKEVYVCDLQTDSSGCFAHTLQKVKNASLYIFSINGNPAYQPTDKFLGLSDLHSFGRFLTLEVSRITDLAIKINRENKGPLRDTLIVSWETNGTEGEDFYPYRIVNYRINSQTGLIWIGGEVKSEIRTKVYADKNTIVHWELFRNGTHRHIFDTIFCKRDVANSIGLVY